MTDFSLPTIHQWQRALDDLSRQFAGLSPADRGLFVRHLLGEDDYECADPLPNGVAPASNELLLAIAARLTDADRVTTSASPRRDRQGEFATADISDLVLELA